jgi:uncharacterized protein YmfQ (DUF2313 family)
MNQLSPNSKERMQAVQSSLNEMGVYDIKFYIRATNETPESHVLADVLHVMESCVSGDMEKLPPIGDTRTK